jgi:hypothetical protein
MVSIPESVVGGDSDAVILKTTSDNNIIVELAFPKVGISFEDLCDAVNELELFISDRLENSEYEKQIAISSEPAPTFEYNADEEKPEHFI